MWRGTAKERLSKQWREMKQTERQGSGRPKRLSGDMESDRWGREERSKGWGERHSSKERECDVKEGI